MILLFFVVFLPVCIELQGTMKRTVCRADREDTVQTSLPAVVFCSPGKAPEHAVNVGN